MELFEEWCRTDARPSGRSETHWHFLDRVAGPFWEQARLLLNEWFHHLTQEEARKGLWARIRSRDDTDFRSASAELYVHESLIRAGYSVTYEPRVSGTDRRPDFLAERGGESMFVEVTSRQISEDDAGGAIREAALYDAVDSLQTENFLLTFDVEARGVSAISARPIKQRLLKWLATLDPDAVTEALTRGDWRAMPE